MNSFKPNNLSTCITVGILGVCGESSVGIRSNDGEFKRVDYKNRLKEHDTSCHLFLSVAFRQSRWLTKCKYVAFMRLVQARGLIFLSRQR